MPTDSSLSESPDPLLTRVRPLRLITIGLMIGILIIAGVMIYLVQGPNQGVPIIQGAVPVISIVAVALMVAGIGLGLLLPKLFSKAMLRQMLDANPKAGAPTTLADRLMSMWYGQVLIRSATWEAPAIFAVIAYFLEAQPFVLAVPVRTVLLLLFFFPTSARLRAWLDEQEQQLRVLREQPNPS